MYGSSGSPMFGPMWVFASPIHPVAHTSSYGSASNSGPCAGFSHTRSGFTRPAGRLACFARVASLACAAAIRSCLRTHQVGRRR